MTTATMTRKAATRKTAAKKTGRRRSAPKRDLPSSAELLVLSGREYMIVSVDDFEEWDEDRQLGALAAQRLAEDDELIPAEEVDAFFEARKR